MITFWELLKDAGDLLASLDSRIWKTLGLLMFRPGRLTLEYLQGKRARFVPPVRLFIASSIVFFFIASLNTRLEFGPDDAVSSVPAPASSWRTRAVGAQRQAHGARAPGARGGRAPSGRARRKSRGEGGDRAHAPRPGGTGPGRGRGRCRRRRSAAARGASGTAGGIGFDRDCNVDYSGAPDWLVKLVPPERAVEICERITADHGRSFARALLSNVPAMMFLFLPLMGVVMKLAYPLSGRYYAEHLLFLVHYHSFFFLLNIMLIVARWGAELVAPGPCRWACSRGRCSSTSPYTCSARCASSTARASGRPVSSTSCWVSPISPRCSPPSSGWCCIQPSRCSGLPRRRSPVHHPGPCGGNTRPETRYVRKLLRTQRETLLHHA
jgi:hypothetical protein